MDFGTADDAARDGDDMGEWEWPRDRCSELREIESLLRCQICGDFLHGPVLLPCSHAFCSECVRKFLQLRGAHGGCCPECKQQCAPSDLIANRSMEKVAVLFQQLKPKLLQVLDAGSMLNDNNNSTAAAAGAATTKHSPASDNSSTNSATKRAANGKARAVERLPVVSYNVMKDKEIRKLLESIGIRLPVKNRDEIIQIHKEFVLLNNAQIDSIHPKSAARLREDVIKNHKLRQQGKHQAAADAAKNRHATTSTTPTLSAVMKANFERLKHEIAERKANPQRAASTSETIAASTVDVESIHVPLDAVDPPTLLSQDSSSTSTAGVWRHVYSHSHRRELFVHSITREIRLERPLAFAPQQMPKNRYDDDFEDNNNAPGATGGTTGGGALTSLMPHRRSSSSGTSKRPAGFFSPDVSAATQDFALSSDDDLEEASRRKRTSVDSSSSSSIKETTVVLTATAATAATVTVIDDSDDTEELATIATAGHASEGDSAKWDCPRCTLVNDTSASQCEACGYDANPSTSTSAAATGTPSQASARKRQKKMHFQSKISLG